MILKRPLPLGIVNNSEVIDTRSSLSIFVRTKTIGNNDGNNSSDE
jgi:hypothetical protein